MITGEENPDSGMITCSTRNGVKTSHFIRQVGIISQHPFLFNDTVRYNLSLGQEFSDQELETVLKQVKLDHELADGLDFVITNNGENVSGGQRVRIELARFLLRKKDILLADEVTAALDVENTVSGEIKLEDIPEKITVKSSQDAYDIIYKEDKLTMQTSFDKKIVSVIEYLKDNILEGRVIKLVSRLTSENNNFQNINETVLSDEEKTLLTEKINTLQQTRYQEIMAKYDEQIKSIDNLITAVYDKKGKLDQIQREMVSLSTIINLPEAPAQSEISTTGNTNTTNSNNNSGTQANNSQSNNQQQGNNKNSVNDTAEKLKEIFGKKDNKK